MDLQRGLLRFASMPVTLRTLFKKNRGWSYPPPTPGGHGLNKLLSKQNIELPEQGSAVVSLRRIRKAPAAYTGKVDWIYVIWDTFTKKRRAGWKRKNRGFPRTLRYSQDYTVLRNHAMYEAGLFLILDYFGDSFNNPIRGIKSSLPRTPCRTAG